MVYFSTIFGFLFSIAAIVVVVIFALQLLATQKRIADATEAVARAVTNRQPMQPPFPQQPQQPPTV